MANDETDRNATLREHLPQPGPNVSGAEAAPELCNGCTDGRDALTGLLHHRAFIEALARTRGQCRRRNEPLSLLLLDLDRFRDINTTHSHQTGDLVLVRVGALLRQACRDGDIVARYSWDRFAAALPGTTEAQALLIARRCSDKLAAGEVGGDAGTIAIRASIGAAESRAGFVESSPDLIDRAEHALAAAKQDGGRRVVAFSALTSGSLSRRRLDQASIDTVSRWVGSMRQQLRMAYLESTSALVGAVEAKDPHTRQHSLRVRDYTGELARRLGLTAAQIESLQTAAALHDVGKIGVPDAILLKPGPLTEDEFALIRQHPETALQILGHATFLSSELPTILHHHERYDGTGYPARLAGEQIPFPARILAVADALDAMSSRRSYKDVYGLNRIRNELEAGSAEQWDPAVVDAALQWLAEDPGALQGSDSAARRSTASALMPVE